MSRPGPAGGDSMCSGDTTWGCGDGEDVRLTPGTQRCRAGDLIVHCPTHSLQNPSDTEVCPVLTAEASEAHTD